MTRSQQVPRIVVRTTGSPPAGLVIQRDDVTLTSASLGVPLPVNPGRHVVGASAPGRQKWTKEISLRVGDPVSTIEVPELAPIADRSPAAHRRSLGPGHGVGTFFALRASALDEESKAHCDPDNTTSCSTEGVQMRENALGAPDVATVAFVAAGVLVVVGAVLFFTAPSRAKSAATSFYGTALIHRF